MKGDISLELHRTEKRYSGVRGQQGRVFTDADFNAAFDAVDQSLHELVRSLVCAAGSPDAGFEITAPSIQTEPVPQPPPTGPSIETIDFNIAPGTFVLGGHALSLQSAQTYLGQTDWLSHRLSPGEYPDAPTVASLGTLPGGVRHDLVYVEMVERPVRAVEDREVFERALGGADTTTRLRPQLTFHVLDGTPDECMLAAESMRVMLAGATGQFSEDGTELLSDARLAIDFGDETVDEDPCAPAEIDGYRGAENHTVKVLLSDTNEFVWAYDHGEPLYRVLVDAATSEVQFLTEPRDPVLYPRPGQTIEILPWDVLLPNDEKAAAPVGEFLTLDSEYDPSTQRIGVSDSLPDGWDNWINSVPASWLSDEENDRFFYARVWQEPPAATAADVLLTGTNIHLHFLNDGLVGDYWTASLRPEAPDLIVPWGLMDTAVGIPPVGPRRFYAPLAIITWSVSSGAVVGTVHDCRNKFRRLCNIKNCCTFQVGDGRVSFGDFNNIQSAVDALPPDGGEICLLPGRHEGIVDLSGVQNVRIHGCGYRSIVTHASGEMGPVFTIDGATRITLADFAIEHLGDLAIAGGSTPTAVSLERLQISVLGAAIRVTSSSELRLIDCVVRSSEFASPIDAAAIGDLKPLVFIKGDRITLLRNRIEAENPSEDPMRLALGGVHIASESEHVRIRENTITGGLGNGITLGSVTVESRPVDGESGGWEIPPPIIISPDGCIVISPGDGEVVDEPSGTVDVIVSEGDLRDLLIRNNDIFDMGMSAISVAFWFLPVESGDDALADDIEIHTSVIAENTVRRCMQKELAESLPLEQAFASAFGGIVLSSVTDLQVEDNDIRDCGRSDSRTPLCGIYVRYGERLHIASNRIFDNGRAATLADPMLVGNIGGLVVSMVESGLDELGSFTAEDDREAQPRMPAIFVKDNVVVSPEGRALDLTGTGPMLVESNSLSCYGNNGIGVILGIVFGIIIPRALAGEDIDEIMEDEFIVAQFEAAKAQLGGSAVSIVNLGFPMVPGTVYLARWSALSGKATAGIVGDILREGSRVIGGEIMFNDNAVTFDGLADAMTFSLCSVLLASGDDVAMHDNQCTVETREDFVPINALALGLLSARVQGNRFKETIKPTSSEGFSFSTVFSAMSYGHLNATENNQGNHCFYRIGAKKPRIVTSAAGLQILDTNRHLIPDEHCARYQESNYYDGTEYDAIVLDRLPFAFMDTDF